MRPTKVPVAFWWVLLVVSVVVLAVLLFDGEGNYNWSRLYTEEEKQPYSSDILYKLMRLRAGEEQFFEVTDSLQKTLNEHDSPANDTYLFIGDRLFADGAEAHALKEFVSKGNTAYILTETLDTRVFDSLMVPLSEELKVPVEFNDESLTFEKAKIDKSREYEADSVRLFLTDSMDAEMYLVQRIKWKPALASYSSFELSGQSITGDSIETLGKATLHIVYFGNVIPQVAEGDVVNFVKIPVGNGVVYLHTMPLAFTNINLKDDGAMHYAQEVFSHMGPGAVIWDKANRRYDPSAFSDGSTQPSSEGPLEFILSKPPLRYAWYTLLVAGVLYLIFGARRKQRAVQVKKPLQNTSIRYAEAIARLFMEEKDHDKLIVLKMEIFKSFLRDRYSIKFSKRFPSMEQKELHDIHIRSGIELARVEQLFQDYLYLSSIVGVNTSQMTSFHRQIEYFLAHCK